MRAVALDHWRSAKFTNPSADTRVTIVREATEIEFTKETAKGNS